MIPEEENMQKPMRKIYNRSMNMAPTRQEVNKAELIAKRSQVFLLCQKDTFISVLKKIL